MHEQWDAASSIVSTATITQATAATFSDLFTSQIFLCFIRSGTKRVLCPIQGELIGREGDLLVFPPGSIVTLENRPRLDADYRADAVYFSRDLIGSIFGLASHRADRSIRILRQATHDPIRILNLVQATLRDDDLPASIRRHRLLEPLVWLRHHGIVLTSEDDPAPFPRVRRLVETDPSRVWRAADVAGHFAMSEATFRRWLARSGHGFSKIVLNTRLERGLMLLQSTDRPVSTIALDCGFKTPSHFADAFRRRFGLQPTAIRSTGPDRSFPDTL
jgi:AraC-like DNA-binding protein